MRIMIGRRLVHIAAHLPCCARRKYSKDPKEDPRQLQPQLAGQLHKRSPHRLAKALAALLQPPSCLNHLGRSPRGLLPQPTPRVFRFFCSRRRSRSLNPIPTLAGRCLRRRIWSSRCIHCSHHRLSRQPGTDPQHPPKSSRIHTCQCSRSYAHTQEARKEAPVGFQPEIQPQPVILVSGKDAASAPK
jgi:hypothetical protein